MSTASRRGSFKPAFWRLNRVTRRNNAPGELQMRIEKYDNPNIRNQRALELRRVLTKDISKFSVSNDGVSLYFVVYAR